MKKQNSIFIFSLIIMGLATIISCKKKDDTSTSTTPSNNTPAVTINSMPQFTGNVGGTNLSLVTPNTGSAATSSDDNLGTDTCTFVYEAWISSLTNATTIQVTKGTLLYVSGYPDNTTFQKFFPVGTLPYSANGKKGIAIDYWDATNVHWSTSNSPATESGMTFTVSAEKDEGNGYARILANFNCILYDSLGHSKTLTNGVFLGDFNND
jgi:hypothetical protein